MRGRRSRCGGGVADAGGAWGAHLLEKLTEALGQSVCDESAAAAVMKTMMNGGAHT
jgi:hypothetical protein